MGEMRHAANADISGMSDVLVPEGQRLKGRGAVTSSVAHLSG